MIKKIKIYITLAAVAFSSVSCLDKNPEDAIPEGDAIRTVEDTAAVMDKIRKIVSREV